jgi:coenzyme F420 biosynthesis associated uncharacterized protein
VTELVDWALAETTARRLMRPGPVVPPEEAALVVADLRRLAAEATGHVELATGLHPAGDAGSVAVVDRTEWVRSNVASLRLLASPLLERLADQARRGNPVTLAAGRRLTGLQIGTTMAFLGGRVLGQYEVFLPDAATGRLALVAPNIVAAERALGVDPHDFRLWVCLHEQTHRLQFTAVPWLREHLEGLVRDLADATDLDPASLAGRLRGVVGGLRTRREDGSRPALIELLQTPEQRLVLDRVQALMTLLEGHAEWAMDVVGPEVVPTVADIRSAFDRRRGSTAGPLDRVLRRLLGLDLKLEQYRKGAVFVRAVVERCGVGGLNTVWESPATLPTRAELADPTGWMRRVLGSAATLPAG